MSCLTSADELALEAKTLGQVFSHYSDSPLNPFDLWRRSSFDPSLSFPQPSQIPNWYSPILMRVWDYDSSAQLVVYCGENGKLHVYGGFKVEHDPPPSTGVSRLQALNSHAVYQIYDICFISTTKSFRDMRQRVRNIYNRKKRVEANPVFITFIDVGVLGQGPWSPLYVPEEHESYHVPLMKGGNSYGNYEWYTEGVLVIREIPEEAIVGTVIASNLNEEPFPNWDNLEKCWKDLVMERLPSDSTTVLSPFVQEQTGLWKP
jgi:hypothetical protein